VLSTTCEAGTRTCVAPLGIGVVVLRLAVMVIMTIMRSMRRMSIAEAKARFADAVKKAEGGERILVTRYGSDVAAIVPISELVELKRLRGAKAARGLAALAGGWDGSAELAASVEAIQRSRSRAR